MKAKNIFKKTINLSVVATILLSLMLTPIAYASTALPSDKCDGIRFVVSIIAVIFLALTLWIISPIGVLFLLSTRTLLSKSPSMLKRKFAWVIRGIAFLTWISVMFLLLIIYIDAVSYKILDLGGDVLNLAIISGVAFFVVMMLVIFIEKTICCCENDSNKKSIPKKNKKSDNSIKFAGIEFVGAKGKTKRKIKEKLKKIIGREIDKRL